MTEKMGEGKGTIIAAVITAIASLIVGIAGGWLGKGAIINNTAVAAVNLSIGGKEYAISDPSDAQQIAEELNAEISRLEAENEAALRNEYDKGFEDGKKSLSSSTEPVISTTPKAPMNSKYLVDIAPPYDAIDTEFYSITEHKDNPYFKNAGTSFEMSVSGKMYFNGLVWTVGNSGFSYHTLDGKYNEIKGIVGHAGSAAWGVDSAVLLVICDGVSRYEVPLSHDAEPKEVTFDVRGVTTLKFLISGRSNIVRARYGFANVEIH